MCRLKCVSLGRKFLWNFISLFVPYLFVVGATSFGLGLQLMEYAEQPDLTPVFAGLPTLVAGFLGLFGRLSKKSCVVTCFTMACVISGVLSIHMNCRFIGKELPMLPTYERHCRSELHDDYNCDLYSATIILCLVSVLMIPIGPLGLIIYFAAKRVLGDKDCFMIWCQFGKVEPLQEVLTATSHGQRHNPQTTSNEFPSKHHQHKRSSHDVIVEIPGSNATFTELDYVPPIPSYQEIGHQDASNLGYSASTMYSESTGRSPESDLGEAYSYELTTEVGILTPNDLRLQDVDLLKNSDEYRATIASEEVAKYQSQEELKVGYLDRTIVKRSRKTAVSDEGDIERDNDFCTRTEQTHNANVNLSYSTLTRPRKVGEANINESSNAEENYGYKRSISPILQGKLSITTGKDTLSGRAENKERNDDSSNDFSTTKNTKTHEFYGTNSCPQFHKKRRNRGGGQSIDCLDLQERFLSSTSEVHMSSGSDNANDTHQYDGFSTSNPSRVSVRRTKTINPSWHERAQVFQFPIKSLKETSLINITPRERKLGVSCSSDDLSSHCGESDSPVSSPTAHVLKTSGYSAPSGNKTPNGLWSPTDECNPTGRLCFDVGKSTNNEVASHLMSQSGGDTILTGGVTCRQESTAGRVRPTGHLTFASNPSVTNNVGDNCNVGNLTLTGDTTSNAGRFELEMQLFVEDTEARPTIDDFFSAQIRQKWIKVSTEEGKYSVDLVPKNMTREEFEELLPYIM